MLNQYKFTVDPVADTCLAVARVSGVDGNLNAAAGRYLLELPRSDPNKSHDPFLNRCAEYGWIVAGELNGRARLVNEYPHLKRLQIELTRHCNLKCAYCYSESGPQRRSGLTLDRVMAVLEQADQMGCIWLDLTGGEFFLYPHWSEVLDAAGARGFVITIHTNGTTLTDRVIAAMVSTGVRTLQVSFDSHDADVHDRARGRVGAFDKAVRGVCLAKAAGIRTRVCFMVHKANVAQIGHAIEYFTNGLGVPVALDRVVRAGGELKAEAGLSAAEYYEAIVPFLSRQVSSTKICEGSKVNLQAIEPHCGVASSFVYLTADGEFAICPTMTSRDSSAFEGPRLPAWDLRRAWIEGPVFERLRRVNCRNVLTCRAGSSCRGGCRSNAYIETQDVTSPDVVSCNINKNPTDKFIDFIELYDSGRFEMTPSTFV